MAGRRCRWGRGARVRAGLMLLALAGGARAPAGEDASESLLAAARVALSAPVGPDEIPVGVCLPLSGRLSTYGQSALAGVLGRMDEWNRTRAAGEKILQPLVFDNGSDVGVIRRQFELVAARRDPPIPAVVGPLFTEGLLAIEGLSRRHGIVVITPLTSTRAVTHENPWVFRSATGCADQAAAMARFLVRNFGVRTTAILVDPRHAVSRSLARHFRAAFALEGGEVVAEADFTPGPEPKPGDADDYDERGTGGRYDEALAAIAQAAPETLYIPCHAAEIIEIVQAVEAMPALRGVRLCGPDLWDNQLVFDGSGRRLVGAVFTSSLYEEGLPYAPFQRFLQVMREAGIEQADAQTVCAYDATSLLIEALVEHGGDAGGAREALLAMRRRPLATGATSMTGDGDARKPVMVRVVEARDGWPTPVYAEIYTERALRDAVAAIREAVESLGAPAPAPGE